MIKIYESKHFQYDSVYGEEVFCLERGPIVIPVLRAKKDYLEAMTKAHAELYQGKRRSIRHNIAHAYFVLDNPSLRLPIITEVQLHPDYDILITRGIMGSHCLGFQEFDDFPNKVEEFTDEQMELFLQKHFASPEEFEEIRSLERRIAEQNPQYRSILKLQS